MWSRHSGRIVPIRRSACGFCQGTRRTRDDFAETHSSHTPAEDVAIDGVVIPQHPIAERCGPKGLNDSVRRPLCRRGSVKLKCDLGSGAADGSPCVSIRLAAGEARGFHARCHLPLPIVLPDPEPPARRPGGTRSPRSRPSPHTLMQHSEAAVRPEGMGVCGVDETS